MEAKGISDITNLIQGQGAIVTQGIYHITGSQLNQLVNAWKKAGQQDSDKRWRQILRDSVTLAKMTGIRETVEWIDGWNFWDTLSDDIHREWQAKKEKWGYLNELPNKKELQVQY